MITMVDQPTWFKSSYSDPEGANCLEVTFSPGVRVRDSKTAPTGPELHVSAPRLVGVHRRSSARSLSPVTRALPLVFWSG
ncbi:DUF397 domain-containing protein [Streptomyces mutabilis]|uniref:DUF397 domain-containing protein n=1 Tax=Streptomyces mutabilis TaxID=67332 RepID=UPI0034DE320A